MKKRKLNDDWFFYKEGAESQKKMIRLPHDAMLEETRDPQLENGNATAYYPGGTYIYTRKLFGDKELEHKKLLVEFEGIYMDSTVYLNGEKVGGWIYGYTNFYVDISGKLQSGVDNELKVVVDNSQTPNSRWYSGSGIYRPVNLWVGDANAILPEAVRVKTISTNPASIEVSLQNMDWSNVTTEDEVRVSYYVRDKKDSEVIISSKVEIPLDDIENKEQVTCASSILEIPCGRLWSEEDPYLYELETQLVINDQLVDSDRTCFGIRQITWSATHGLQINGKTVKLRGGCIHHDNGMLGACTYDKAERRRVMKLKEMGFNAIRYSHNPVSKNLMDICDEVGMYLLDESFDQWKIPQTTYDYARHFDTEWKKDVTAMVAKDYNHPSVIMYCIGNEITDTGLPHGAMIGKMLNEAFHELDDTRPTTIAINSMLSVLADMQAKKQAAEASKTEEEKAAEVEAAAKQEKAVGSQEVNDLVALLPKIMASITPESLEALIGECVRNVDIVGYNYGQNLYEGTHELVKDRVILSSETFPAKMASNWDMVMKHDYVIGDFMWTAWDYLGETGVGLPTYGMDKAPFSKPYPCLTAACGSFDLNGTPETQAYYSAIIWGAYRKPYIAVRPLQHGGEAYTLGNWRQSDAIVSWDWKGYEGHTADIEVYSIGAEIELYCNDKSMGRKQLEDKKALYQLAYEPGELLAVSYDENGTEIARTILATTGEETKLSIHPEQNTITSDGEDLAYVDICIEDACGNLKMNEKKQIRISVEGAGELLAFGSANPVTEENFHTGTYTSYHGKTTAIIRSTGESGVITITAGDGTQEVTAELRAR